MNRLAQTLLVVLSLFAYTQATSLQCGFRDENWLAVSNLYTCTGVFNVTGDDPTILSVGGDHVGTNENDQVTGISIYNQGQIQSIPQNFDEFFANIEAFEWVFGNLTTLSPENLAQFPNLRILTVYGNNILQLESSLFRGTPSIAHIDFGANALNYVQPGIFEGLSLETALFERNPCVSFSAGTESSLDELIWYLSYQCRGLSVAVLDCEFRNEDWLGPDSRFTCIGSIIGSGTNGTVSGVAGDDDDINAVVALSIYNQRGFEAIPFGLQNFFPELTALEWVFGDLRVLAPNDLLSFPNLDILILYGNEIVNLDGNLFQGTQRLQHIDFSNNILAVTGPGLLDVPTLEVALFERNNCISFSAGTPESLDTLRTLLNDQCQPIQPPGDECPAACGERIDELERRIEELESSLQILMAKL